MKPRNENKLDKLFEAGLNGFEDHIAFRDEDWVAMEKLLDGKSSKRIIPSRWMWAAAGIAAVLLLLLTLFLNIDTTKEGSSSKLTINKKARIEDSIYNSKKIRENHDQGIASVKKRKVDSISPLNKIGANTEPKLRIIIPVTPDLLNTDNHNKGFAHNKPKVPVAQGNGFIRPAQPQKDTLNNFDKIAGNTPSRGVGKDSVLNAGQLAAVSPVASNVKPITSQSDSLSDVAKAVSPLADKTTGTKAPVQAQANMPRLSFAVLAAPDINSVNGLSNGQIGTNFGMQVSVQITKKLSISTGAGYAIKPYRGAFGQYNLDPQIWSDRSLPTNIVANCKVLDIPVNINYQLYHKGANTWSVGSGLSSYFMLKENYAFEYGSSSSVFNLQIENQNRHVLGVLNLNATYQRQINPRFGLLVQPYYKLPLTQIGYGRVDLRSAGVAVGLSLNVGRPNKKVK